MLTAVGLWDFVTGPATLAVLAATLLLAWPIGRRLARRFRCPRVTAVLFTVVAGTIVALTLTPNLPAVPGQPPPHFLSLLGQPGQLRAQLTAAPRDQEQLANIALYVPLGVLGRFVWHNAARSAAAGLLLTAVIETCQYGIVGRAGSLTDIRNNAIGAALGALVAAVAVHTVLRDGSRARTPA